MFYLKIVRTVFEDTSPEGSKEPRRFVIVMDMDEQMELSTKDIPGLIGKMESALPEIFPDENSQFTHNCGGGQSEIEEHSFREEIEHGTNIPHLLEHILLHLLSRRVKSCSAFCGQKSTDIEKGILTRYYLVLDCPSKIEAVVAVELAFNMLKAWIEGQEVSIDADAVFAGIREMIDPMLSDST